MPLGYLQIIHEWLWYASLSLPPPRNWKRPPWTLSLFSHPPSENIFACSSLAQLYSMQNKEKKINMDRMVNSQQSGAAITELFISLSGAPVTKRKLFGKLVAGPLKNYFWGSSYFWRESQLNPSPHFGQSWKKLNRASVKSSKIKMNSSSTDKITNPHTATFSFSS